MINKEKQSEKIKNQLLDKKKKREEKNSYITAQNIVKDYREKQKSHAAYKRKTQLKNNIINFYDETRQGTPIILIRIAGYYLI